MQQGSPVIPQDKQPITWLAAPIPTGAEGLPTQLYPADVVDKPMHELPNPTAVQLIWRNPESELVQMDRLDGHATASMRALHGWHGIPPSRA